MEIRLEGKIKERRMENQRNIERLKESQMENQRKIQK
jgi:hypothetical protein